VTIEYEVEKDVRAQSYFNIEGEHPNIVACRVGIRLAKRMTSGS